MFCRYCNKEIDSELVEHISITHADIAIKIILESLPSGIKYSVLDDVFPGFRRYFLDG